MSEFTEDELSNLLSELKQDLQYQATFEDLDWDYFEDTVQRAREIDARLQEIRNNDLS
jgi:hypothetical protein